MLKWLSLVVMALSIARVLVAVVVESAVPPERHLGSARIDNVSRFRADGGSIPPKPPNPSWP